MLYLDMGDPVLLAFPTPFFRHRWPEVQARPVNAALKAEILARRERSPTAQVSNVGGWQSEPDIMNWPVPEMAQLSQWINQAYRMIMGRELGTNDFKSRYEIAGWANINESGHYNRTHIHSDHHWSGVYYVDCGRPDPKVSPNGAIEIVDPRSAVGVLQLPNSQRASGIWELQPEPGTMLLFPSWLRHSVLPYFGDGPRISVAFNLRVTKFTFSNERDADGPGG
jgi:uncharacterized protein (TIGR02466 family)